MRAAISKSRPSRLQGGKAYVPREGERLHPPGRVAGAVCGADGAVQRELSACAGAHPIAACHIWHIRHGALLCAGGHKPCGRRAGRGVYCAACTAQRRCSAPHVPYYRRGECLGFRAGTGRPDSVFCAQPGNCAKRAVQCAAGCFLWNMVFVSASFAPRGRLLRRGAAHVVRVRPARALRRAAPLWGAAQPPYSYGPQGPGAQPVPPQGACAPPAAPQPPQQGAAPFAYQPQAAQSSVPPAQPAPPQATPAQPGPGAMVCPACGMQGAPGASFCTVCGAHLVPAAQAPAQPKEGEPHV